MTPDRLNPAAGPALLLWGAAEALPLDQLVKLLSLLPPILVGVAMLCREASGLLERLREGRIPVPPTPPAADAPPTP